MLPDLLEIADISMSLLLKRIERSVLVERSRSKVGELTDVGCDGGKLTIF